MLARSQRFAGFGSSTFSFYLREYRALHVSRAALAIPTSLLLGWLEPHSISCITLQLCWRPAGVQGISRSTSALVDAHVIGTDSLFHTAGTVVDNGQALDGLI